MVKKKIANVDVLPEELLTEVLVRLPVKTLLVCKSVSKPWLSLISTPYFIKSHLHYVISNTNNPKLLDILYHSKVHNVPEVVPFNGDISSIQDMLDNAQVSFLSCMRKLDVIDDFIPGNMHASSSWLVLDVMPRDFGNSRVVGTSCNGIICLTDDKVVYLWNPSIRRCKEVSIPELDVSSLGRVRIGFGYDSLSNDYKVFRSICYMNLDRVPLKLQVYSVNSDSWREFQGPVWGKELEEKEFQRNEYTVVNGILYFSNGDEHQLISFDLCKEVFRVVPFPSFVQRKWSDVLDFKGSVAMAFESVSGVDLWTLDGDVSGQVSSWTKIISIRTDVTDLKLDMWLSCYLGAGQFYAKKLLNGNVFVSNLRYDCDQKKETEYRGCGGENFLGTVKYMETLVSLDGFHQLEENAN